MPIYIYYIWFDTEGAVRQVYILASGGGMGHLNYNK